MAFCHSLCGAAVIDVGLRTIIASKRMHSGSMHPDTRHAWTPVSLQRNSRASGCPWMIRMRGLECLQAPRVMLHSSTSQSACVVRTLQGRNAPLRVLRVHRPYEKQVRPRQPSETLLHETAAELSAIDLHSRRLSFLHLEVHASHKLHRAEPMRFEGALGGAQQK